MSRWVLVFFGLSFLSGAWGEENPSSDDGYHPLFDGKDLQGWLADPLTLAHWKVRDGIIETDGKGQNLISEVNFRDFEMIVEWRARLLVLTEESGSAVVPKLRSRIRP